MPRHDICRNRPAAAIGHQRGRDPAHLVEQRRGEMHRGSVAAMPDRELARLAFAAAITSFSEEASNFGVATRMKGEVPTSVIGIRSLPTSYGIFRPGSD